MRKVGRPSCPYPSFPAPRPSLRYTVPRNRTPVGCYASTSSLSSTFRSHVVFRLRKLTRNGIGKVPTPLRGNYKRGDDGTVGSIALPDGPICNPIGDVCCYSKSGQTLARLKCSLRANSRHSRVRLSPKGKPRNITPGVDICSPKTNGVPPHFVTPHPFVLVVKREFD